MTLDDRYATFLGNLADKREELKLSAFEYGFADDNRFSFNFSPKMRKVVEKLIAKYGNLVDWPKPK